ncbi:hypothetical protein PIB30_008256 [Stylosanthes scabra]|uniref:Uncharacterized protein n=1 Tax=Stylosanthes scabra TaxID=79078 RepID=A0ABU6R4E8_9FABA|nr:hypothetical protein [Stylosanthes scabra]
MATTVQGGKFAGEEEEEEEAAKLVSLLGINIPGEQIELEITVSISIDMMMMLVLGNLGHLWLVLAVFAMTTSQMRMYTACQHLQAQARAHAAGCSSNWIA